MSEALKYTLQEEKPKSKGEVIDFTKHKLEKDEETELDELLTPRKDTAKKIVELAKEAATKAEIDKLIPPVSEKDFENALDSISAEQKLKKTEAEIDKLIPPVSEKDFENAVNSRSSEEQDKQYFEDVDYDAKIDKTAKKELTKTNFAHYETLVDFRLRNDNEGFDSFLNSLDAGEYESVTNYLEKRKDTREWMIKKENAEDDSNKWDEDEETNQATKDFFEKGRRSMDEGEKENIETTKVVDELRTKEEKGLSRWGKFKKWFKN